MTYASEVLADTPLQYLRLGDASGSTTAVDSSGNGRNGTRSQGAFGATGLIATDPTDTAYTGPTSASTGIGTAYASWMNQSAITVECWVKGTAGGLMVRDAQSGTRCWQVAVSGTGKVVLTIIAGAIPTLTSATSVDDNTTHHIVVTYDGTTAKIYIDGVLDATGTLSQALPQPTQTGLTIGNSNRTASFRYNGTIDEAAFYGSVLSQARVTAHYQAGTGTTPPPLEVTAPGTTPVPTGDAILDAILSVTAPGTTPVPTGDAILGTGSIVADGVTPAPTGSADLAGGLVLSAAGTVTPPYGDATLTTTREVTATGTAPTPTGTATISVPRFITAPGTVPTPAGDATLAPEWFITAPGTTPVPTSDATLDFPPATDTSNRVGGRRRTGLGVAEWNPPVADPPPAYDAGQAWVYAQALTVPTIVGTMPRYGVTMERALRPDDRLVIGNQDVTYFRDVPTPFPGYSLAEPLMYGPTTITFPQIAAPFETPGEGALRWLDVGKQVLIQRVDPDTRAVVKEDYVGVVIGFDHDGPALTVQVGGEAMGRAALVNRQVPIWSGTQDIGRYMYSAFKDLGLRLTPYLGPETGVRLQRFGGQSVLDYISELVARSWNRQGNRWTVMPDQDVTTRGVYKMKRKDTTTIHATAYVDDTRVRPSLHRDAAEEPNRIYGTGITPNGQRIRNGVYPGLRQTLPPPYPFNDGRDFGPGTDDGDTDTGDGITLMIRRLIITKYLDQPDTPGGYDAGVAHAIRALQEDASDGTPSFVTGVMDTDTWKALYDLDVTGYSLRWSHIEPMAQDPRVRPWNVSGTGAVRGRNPRYQPARLKVDRNIDFGSGYTSQQMREWSRAELEQATGDPNYTGSITINLGAVIRGEHNPGNPLTAADVMNARDLRPGWNLWLPLFAGGILVHIAAVNVGSDGTVSVDVDTRARDAMEVWEVISRNRESRNSPARAWQADHRSSTMTKDSIGIWDEVGGELGDDVDVPANTWVVFPVVAGQEGTVRALRVRTNPDAEYVMAVFGAPIYDTRLARLIGNPMTRAGKQRWADESTRDLLARENLLLYVAGDKQEPLGYFPNTKRVEDDPDTPTEESGTNPLTGRWEDEAGFPYYTGEHPVLWVAVYADRATTIPAGRLMYNQLEAGV